MSKLIFVYNANSGTRNALKESLQKLINPQTLTCRLCSLTYGFTSEKTQWKKFKSQTSTEMQFLHADEFKSQFKSKFGIKYELPVILEQNHYELNVVLSAKEINQLDSLRQLIDKLTPHVTNI
ncbi:GTPase [Psychroflexus sp. ALD_RP9]|uniref:GTPase n=1 Tax=Psychroflexus sp. ALD_RP9 TaxID=2777186 RepID=UPI001F5D98F3|nr:GTPase [Psychroflexus sp. ALD_RP9]